MILPEQTVCTAEKYHPPSTWGWYRVNSSLSVTISLDKLEEFKMVESHLSE